VTDKRQKRKTRRRPRASGQRSSSIKLPTSCRLLAIRRACLGKGNLSSIGLLCRVWSARFKNPRGQALQTTARSSIRWNTRRCARGPCCKSFLTLMAVAESWPRESSSFSSCCPKLVGEWPYALLISVKTLSESRHTGLQVEHPEHLGVAEAAANRGQRHRLSCAQFDRRSNCRCLGQGGKW
jgi:hypothetical protein